MQHIGAIARQTHDRTISPRHRRDPSVPELVRKNRAPGRAQGSARVLEDLLWSDPVEGGSGSAGKAGDSNDQRGAGTLFGPETVGLFLSALGFGVRSIVRSHQVVMRGSAFIPVGHLVPSSPPPVPPPPTVPLDLGLYTVFSAANYGGSGNDGAILRFTEASVTHGADSDESKDVLMDPDPFRDWDYVADPQSVVLGADGNLPPEIIQYSAYDFEDSEAAAAARAR